MCELRDLQFVEYDLRANRARVYDVDDRGMPRGCVYDGELSGWPDLGKQPPMLSGTEFYLCSCGRSAQELLEMVCTHLGMATCRWCMRATPATGDDPYVDICHECASRYRWGEP